MVFCNLYTMYNILIYNNSHNPYFNRWFSAIKVDFWTDGEKESHNPYFNRWFSAIMNGKNIQKPTTPVTILILIDGFLQFISLFLLPHRNPVTILILIDGFLQ